MHLIEIYALTCGLKIDRPFIHTEEVPLPSGKYITFHGDCAKGNSRSYDHWNIVIDGIKDLGYEIVRLGTDPIDVVNPALNESYCKSLNLFETSFVIKNTSLHLGYDSSLVHIASALSKKIVALYSSYSQHSRPYFSNEEDIRLHEPDWNVHLPSYGYQEEEPLINLIPPEKVIQSVKGLLL